MSSKVDCELCGITVSQGQWRYHRRSYRHKKSKDRQRKEEIAGSRVSVTPEEGVEFGTVEYVKGQNGASAKQFMATFKVEVGEQAGVVLQTVRFRDNSRSAVGHLRFSVQKFSRPTDIPPLRFLEVHVHFHPRKDIGSYENLLVFDFAVPLGNGQTQAFSIERTVRGSVGVKEDVERFSAKTPYVKPNLRNRPRANPNNTVTAPNDEFKQNIPWTGKLPFYRIPHSLLELLSTQAAGEVVEHLRRVLGPLSYQNYQGFWKHLLYVETFQAELDVRRYDIFGATLEKTPNGRYFLAVEGLAEKRPSVLRGDRIKVQARNSVDQRWFEGTVTTVEQSRVLLRFAKSFKHHERATFDVQFSVSQIPSRRQHQALGQALPDVQLLFPSPALDPPPAIAAATRLEFFSEPIGSNAAQRQAVAAILNRSGGSGPFVVFGPPGTGKTVTIIEACLQILRDDKSKILLTAPSNSAADLLCSRLGQSKTVILRLNAPSRSFNDVSPSILELSHVEDDSFGCPSLDKLSKFRIVVSTCVSASILRGVGLGRGHFTHIFVDEAGQATEPEAFLPLTLASTDTTVVLAGDPKQLGPIVRSPATETLGLGTSLLERIMSTPQYSQNSLDYRGVTYTKLVKNYRNHRAILDTSNKEFYRNELEPCAPASVTGSLRGWNGWPNADFPIIFHSIRGCDEREGTSPSFFNVAEISVIRNFVESLQSSRSVQVHDSDIGIITPYRAQCSKLRTALKQRDRPQLTIGTVEQFQGSERSIILISTVRSNQKFLEHDKRFALGFLSNEKRFNVAVTRPQAGLIVVGDPEILSLDPLWRRFLSYVHANGGWQGQAYDESLFAE